MITYFEFQGQLILEVLNLNTNKLIRIVILIFVFETGEGTAGSRSWDSGVGLGPLRPVSPTTALTHTVSPGFANISRST